MTDSFPSNLGYKCFLVPRASTAMTTTAGTGDLNLFFPFDGFSIEVVLGAAPTTTTDTFTIGSVTYTFEATPAAANDIDVGTQAVSANSARQALIDGDVSHGEGTDSATTYYVDTVINPDILHAELGMNTASIHVTAASALACASAGSGDVRTEDVGAEARTAMVRYITGDYSELAANSPVATSTVRVVGFMMAGGAAVPTEVDKVLTICDHSGTPVAQPFIPAGSSGFIPCPLPSMTGVSARLDTNTANQGVYVFYSTVR